MSYYCEKCGKNHRSYSKIGKSHKKDILEAIFIYPVIYDTFEECGYESENVGAIELNFNDEEFYIQDILSMDGDIDIGKEEWLSEIYKFLKDKDIEKVILKKKVENWYDHTISYDIEGVSQVNIQYEKFLDFIENFDEEDHSDEWHVIL